MLQYVNEYSFTYYIKTIIMSIPFGNVQGLMAVFP